LKEIELLKSNYL